MSIIMSNLLVLIKNLFYVIQISDDTDQKKPSQAKPGLFDVVKSVLSAFVGVQSDDNRERDFNKGNASDYIIVGIIFIVIFIITLMMVVSSVVDNA